MAAGRPRKPEEVKKIEGTSRKDRTNHNRLNYDKISEAPPAPDYLGPKGKKLYEDLAGHCIKIGVLQEVDLSLLAAYATEMETYLNCQTVFKKKGRVYHKPNINGDKIPMPRPEVKIAQESLAKAIQIASQFGFSPSARERISMKPITPKPSAIMKLLKE